MTCALTKPLDLTVISTTPCPNAASDDVCPITKTDSCPDDQSIIDNCYRC